MSKRIAKFGAAIAGLVAGLVFLNVGTAGADVCSDGWTIYNAYEEMHDAPTAWAMLANLHDMGCY